MRKNKWIKKFICLFLIIGLVLCDLCSYGNAFAQGNLAKLTVKGVENYTTAFKMLNSINEYRKDAGISEIKMDKTLLNGAMARAVDTSIYQDKNRPDGSDFFDSPEFEGLTKGCKGMGYFIIREMAGYTADYIVTMWNVQGYINNLTTNKDVKRAGIGVFTHNNHNYYVLVYSYEEAEEATNKGEVNVTKDIYVTSDKIHLRFSNGDLNLEKGDSKTLCVNQVNKYCVNGAEYIAILENSSFTWKSSNPNVAKVSSNGEVAAISTGDATITATLSDGSSVSCKVKVMGDLSDESQGTTNLSKVKNLHATSVTSNSIKLSWDKVSGADAYSIYYKTTSTGDYRYLKTVSTTYMTDFNLVSNKNYYYKVRALKKLNNKSYYGSYSDYLKVTTKPLQVTNLSLDKNKGTTTSSISIVWDKQNDVTGYEVYKYDSKLKKYTRLALIESKSKNYLTDSKLTSATVYSYKVRSYKTVDKNKVYGSFSNILEATTIPTKVNNLKSTYVGSSSIKLKWDSVSRATGYKVYRSTKKLSGYELIGTVKGKTTYEDKNLRSYTKYYYKVVAFKTLNKVDYKGSSSDVLSKLTTKAKVTGLKVIENNTTSIKLSWNPVIKCDGYSLYRATSKNGKYTLINNFIGENNTVYYNKNLKSGTTYYYKVNAYQYDGTSKVYLKESSILQTSTKPSKVCELTASTTKTSVKLNWKKVNGATEYVITRKSINNEKGKTFKTKNNYYEDKSVDSGYLYTYSVKAYKIGTYEYDNTCEDYKYEGESSKELTLNAYGERSKFVTRNTNYPYDLELGEKFSLEGDILSNYNIRKLKIQIVDTRDNSVKLETTKSFIDTKDKKYTVKEYSLKNMSNNIKFENLKSGNYKYLVYGDNDAVKSKLLIEENFKVKYLAFVHPVSGIVPKLNESTNTYTVDGVSVSSGFYSNRVYNGKANPHLANDYISTTNRKDDESYKTSIVAFCGGTVVETGNNGWAGNYVVIEHNINNKIVYSRYFHLNSIEVSSNTKVNAGDKIGIMGNTGDSFGVHLHFAVTNRRYINELIPAEGTANQIRTEDYLDMGGYRFYNPTALFEKGLDIIK